MEFASLDYISWLVLFQILAWAGGGRLLPWFLCATGLSFVMISAPLSGGILLLQALAGYWFASTGRAGRGRHALLFISGITAVFLAFKYRSSGGGIALPLGISYYTFRLIHYIQERYRMTLRKHTLVEFLAYMTFLPTLLIGPINRFPEFLTDMKRRAWSTARFSRGLERVFYGYAQLIILGNFLVNHVAKTWLTYPASRDDFMGLVFQSMHMWLDLYVRFSAYSSIAIGVSLMAGFHIQENFNAPFLAITIKDFWQRWHISLTQWCRDYIFIPVAAITRMPHVAMAASMIAIGVWHELSLRYILWGLYHTAGIILHGKWSALRIRKGWQGGAWSGRAVSMAGTATTLVFVVLSFPVTRVLNEIVKGFFQ
ncbi:MAG: MBOAT family O-acyltransferase [Pseudomonadota bacterium]